MKYSLFTLFGVLIGLSGGWIIWGNHGLNKTPVALQVTPPVPVPASPISAIHSSPNLGGQPFKPIQVDWQVVEIARKKVLHDHPDLDAENKSLLLEAENQKKAFDAATIKANPAVASIVANLAVLDSSTPTSNSLSPRPTITQSDWQKLMAARVSALKTDSSLSAKTQEFVMKMRAFQEKLKGFMIQEDPQIAPMLGQSVAIPHPQPISFHPQSVNTPATK